MNSLFHKSNKWHMSLTATVKAFIISIDEESIAASTQAHIISLMRCQKTKNTQWKGGGKSMAIADIKRNTQILN